MSSQSHAVSGSAGGPLGEGTAGDGAADGCEAPPAAHGDGGSGAPPSNTAPDNCNVAFLPFRWGIDSLYLSYPGELSKGKEEELRSLKRTAQGPDHEAARAQMLMGEHVFEVKDKSSGLFAFTLVDGAYQIRLSASRSKKLPMAYVQVSSGLLAHKSVNDIVGELRDLLATLGSVTTPKVSRVDLFCDFGCNVDMESWTRNAWVTRASAVHQYAEDGVFTGWSIGAGGALMGRLYQKLIESRKRGKGYLEGLWLAAGWDGISAVWRMEFEFRREVLSQLGIDTVSTVLDNLDGLWSYAAVDWLKLCVPSETDHTRSRWPIHPLWAALASIDWQASGGPLLREFRPTRAPSLEWLGARALSLVASIGAVRGVDDFERASDLLLDRASFALGDRYGMSGISLDQGFCETVQALRRRYNLPLDGTAEEVVRGGERDGSINSNPYYRAKQGL